MSKAVAWTVAILAWLLRGAAVHAGERHYYYTDPQGTVLAEVDAAGAIIETSDYRPYGAKSLGAVASGPGYTGHVSDADSGLVYMQARYYDPIAGTFISTDAVKPSAEEIFEFNRYTYANNSPTNYLDVDGHESGCVSRGVACVHGKMTVPGFVKNGEVSAVGAIGSGVSASMQTDGNNPQVGLVMIGEGLSLSIDEKVNLASINLPPWARKVPFDVAVEVEAHVVAGGKLVLIINDSGKLLVGFAKGVGLGEAVNILSLNHQFDVNVVDLITGEGTLSKEERERQEEWEERQREKASMDEHPSKR